MTLGEIFILVLEAADADGDPLLTFDVPNIPPNAMFNSNGNVLYFTWNVTSADEVFFLFPYYFQNRSFSIFIFIFKYTNLVVAD